MRQYGKLVISGLMAGLLLIYAGSALADKTGDWKRLSGLQAQFVQFQTAYSSTAKDAAYVEAWEEWKKEYESFVPEFIQAYSDNVKTLRKEFGNMDMPEGVQNYPHHMVDLLQFDPGKHQSGMAGWLVKDGDVWMQKWKGMKKPPEMKMELKTDYARRAIVAYKLAEKLAASAAGEKLKEAQHAFEESFGQWETILESLEWPGHNPQFTGPEDPDDIAEAALNLLNNMASNGKQWSKPEYDDDHIPVAACVVGSHWEVNKKELLTQKPLQYTIKIFVLFKGKKDEKIGYGYYMQFYTKEESGVKPETPFYFCNSRMYEKHKMYLSKAENGGGHSAVAGGWFFRLLLSVALFVGGVVAAGELFSRKTVQLVPFLQKAAKQQKPIALLLFGLSVLSLLVSVFTLSLLANILPQLCGIVLGLILFVDGGEGKASVHGVVQTVVDKISPVISVMQPYSKPVGVAAMVLGALHLLAGNMICL